MSPKSKETFLFKFDFVTKEIRVRSFAEEKTSFHFAHLDVQITWQTKFGDLTSNDVPRTATVFHSLSQR